MKRLGLIVAFLLLGTTISHGSFQDGLNAYNEGNFGKAVTIWEEQGSSGDVNSQYNLGIFYERGVEGYPKDLAAAYAWYRLAAAQNAAPAIQAVSRLEPLLTSGQIEDGNKLAISIMGRWYRQNVGLKEEDYKKLVEDRARREKAKIEAEKRAAEQRLKQQRALIAQRDADAKMADKLEDQSRAAALKAAREQAEEAKRKAFRAQQLREEEERLAKLRAENEKEIERNAALKRLQELKAKQQGGSTEPVVLATPQKPVVATAPAAPATPKTPTAATAPAAAPAAPAAQAAPTQQVAPQQVAKSIAQTPTQASSQVQPQAQIQAKPQAQTAQAAPSNSATQATPQTTNVATKPKTVAPPAKPKTTLPVIKNGMDQSVVSSILEKSKSLDLATPQAVAEISADRTNIEALKWSLISAARGKKGAARMNGILAQSMTPAQVVEANRRAAEWILKRQKRG